jgi:choline dehydrogenase-like flavoprotein
VDNGTDSSQKELKGRVIEHIQGKMLGGSSSINAQAMIPPSASDLNAWEEIGNTGWNWQTMKPYLKNFFSLSQPEQGTHDRLDLGWSEKSWSTDTSCALGGLVKASFADVHQEGPLATAWIKTINNLGYPLTDNPFDGASTGPYNGASTIDPSTKTRVSSSIAYYKPVKGRSNLQVDTESLVERILLETDANGNNTVKGVVYSKEGAQKTALADKEVILCAGVFQSPKLLELSGIGDPAILTQHGIDVKVVNPFVGSNLQDHIFHTLSFETRGLFPTRDGLLRSEPEAIQAAMGTFIKDKTGPLTSSAITSFAYLPVDELKNDSQTRDIILSKLSEVETKHPLDKHRISVLQKLIQNQNEGTAQYFPVAVQASLAGGTLQDGDFLTLVAALSHPLSTGTVHINSSDPSEHPTIDHEYLSNPLDVELQARHVRFLQKIAATEPLASLLKENGRRNDERAFIGDDLDKAKQYLKISGSTNFHSCGTCAMAPKDAGGVVDPEFRVYGVKNLRVVDASVIPLVPQSNTQMLVYAVAERAADIIRGRA